MTMSYCMYIYVVGLPEHVQKINKSKIQYK